MTESILCCRISTVLLLLMTVVIGRFERYVVNPMTLFAITPVSLLIYVNLGDVYMVNLTSSTWIIAIINMYAFILAYRLCPSFKTLNLCTGNTNNTSLQIQSFLFYMLSFIGKLIPAVASITWMFPIVSIVCAIKSKKKLMLAFVLLIFLISALGVTSKTAMLTYCVTFIVCFEKYYVTDVRKRRMVKWGLAVGVIFMIFSFSFANKDRGAYDSEEGLDSYSRQGIEWNYSSGLFMPYMYITNGWTNLQYVMETQNNRTYGLWTLKPLLGYFQLKDNFSREYKIIPYSSFNTCAYMTYGFKDFGYWLSVLMSIFLGVFVKRVYSRYRISRSPYDVASYVLVAQATLEMFFSNHFFTQSYPFTIVILMAIVKLFMRQFGHSAEVEKC